MSEFKVKFRGVRGSFPVCDKDFLNFGGNTSCVEVKVGGHLIFLDAGTGIVSAGDDMMEEYISTSVEPSKRTSMKASILLSHIHQDHLLGLTFFKPIHVKSTKLCVFGQNPYGSSVENTLSELVFGKSFPLDLGDVACSMEIHDISDEQQILIRPNEKPRVVNSDTVKPSADDVLISFYKTFVHPQDGVTIYKISYKGKSLVYATDKECYMGGDKKFVGFAQNCDLLIHDAQYTTEDYLSPFAPKQGYGHSTYDMAVEIMKQVKAKRLAFFHYDPSYNDAKLSMLNDYYTSSNKNIFMSREGLEIDLL